MCSGVAELEAGMAGKDRGESDPLTETYVQSDQPEGVPPLELTGERTLPNVPEENYWFRRHLVVYEWIARRTAGLNRVVDLACGEGYGCDVLARSARTVVGVDANPEAFDHARARYGSARISFQRQLVEEFDEPCDAIVFLQTIEHIGEPGELVAGFSRLAPVSYVSTPNLLTLAPPGAEKSDNPWHLREYRIEEFRQLLEPHFSRVDVWGLFHARKLKLHQRAIGLGWDRLHSSLSITRPFYDRFTPAIQTSDFRLGREDLEEALDFVAVCHA